jgi:uncharacterized protein YndB with AHSA1/START domain
MTNEVSGSGDSIGSETTLPKNSRKGIDVSDQSVIHSTFSIERTYEAPAARVFAAWAEPGTKAAWFAGADHEHQLDFRIGGHEMARGRNPEGGLMTFASVYHDIVAEVRIVFSSTLSVDETVATVSITAVEFLDAGGATRLLLTEQGTFLDGLEQPSWREEGTAQQLDALGRQLKSGATGG